MSTSLQLTDRMDNQYLFYW